MDDAQCEFTVKMHIRKNQSAVAVQFAIWIRYGISRNQQIFNWKLIVFWAGNLKETESIIKRRGGRLRTARTPEYIEIVKRSVLRSLGPLADV